MPSSRINQRNVFAAVVVLLLLGAFLPSTWATKLSYVPRAVLRTVMAPLTQPLNGIGARFRSTPPLPREQISLEEMRLRMDELLQKNSELAELLDEAVSRLAEYEMLDELAIRLDFNLEGMSRRSLSVTQSYGHRLIVNKGSAAGLRQGLVVISGVHLVGQVIETTPMAATVRLITSPDNLSDTIEVQLIAPPEDAARANFGLRLHLKRTDDSSAFTAQIRAIDNVQVGDVATMADRRWRNEAKGFFVGRVVSVEPDPANELNYKIVTVQPVRDLATLQSVVTLIPAVE